MNIYSSYTYFSKLQIILVSLGCFNKMSQTMWLKQQKFIPIVLEARKSKIKVLGVLVLDEDSFRGWQMAIFLLCEHGRERETAHT